MVEHLGEVEHLDEESEWLNVKAEHHLPDYPFKIIWESGFLRATIHYLKEIKKLQNRILDLQKENILYGAYCEGALVKAKLDEYACGQHITIVAHVEPPDRRDTIPCGRCGRIAVFTREAEREV